MSVTNSLDEPYAFVVRETDFALTRNSPRSLLSSLLMVAPAGLYSIRSTRSSSNWVALIARCNNLPLLTDLGVLLTPDPYLDLFWLLTLLTFNFERFIVWFQLLLLDPQLLFVLRLSVLLLLFVILHSWVVLPLCLLENLLQTPVFWNEWVYVFVLRFWHSWHGVKWSPNNGEIS